MKKRQKMGKKSGKIWVFMPWEVCWVRALSPAPTKKGCVGHPFFVGINRELTRVEGGAANESERFA